MILPCALVLSTATAAAADGRPPIRFYQNGGSLTVHAADIVESSVMLTRDDTPVLAIEMADPADARFLAFSTGIVGHKIFAVFDGVVWLADVRVPEPIPSGSMEIAGVDEEVAEAFVARLMQLRADPATRDTPMIVLFEQRATIDIARDDIVDIAHENDTATVCLDETASSALTMLEGSDRSTWHLALADQMIADWWHLADDAHCPLRLYDIDSATLAEAGLPGG